MNKPVIGISCGDLNGIGPELIIKTLADARILEHCTPVVFGSGKLFNFYRKSIPDASFNYQIVNGFQRINPRQIHILQCWEEELAIAPGSLTETGGRYAVRSLYAAVQALKEGHLHGLVTAPIHKSNVQSVEFNYTGHTPFLKAAADVPDVLMLLYTERLRVALVTEHVALKDVAKYITREVLLSKISLLHQSLRRDFGIDRPKIAVLGLNPHAGDEGLIGSEEEQRQRQTAVRSVQRRRVFCPRPLYAVRCGARHVP